MKPYYADDLVTIYHGDCRALRLSGDVLVTDPPYPNNAGWFVDEVQASVSVLREWTGEAYVFWSEIDRPPVDMPLVAVHIWHRTNVNGRPYEPIYEYNFNGVKRRSEVFQHAAVFDGAGPGCNEYLGHPTQKPVALMGRIIDRISSTQVIFDPFMGSGSTLRAAKDRGRTAIGIEIEERYCEIAAQRCSQEVLGLTA